jgi:hypothetical protein
MRDDELESWRREWNAQPLVPIELIRKVERQTVYMKLNHFALILPVLIGVGTIVAAVRMRTFPTVLLAVGVWGWMSIAGYFQLKNSRGTWSPVSDTTAAYVELSIRRCRAAINNIRLMKIMTPLLVAVVFGADFLIVTSFGVLKTQRDYLFMFGAFVYAAAIVAVVVWLVSRKRAKIQAELTWLLNLQRQIEK